MHETSADEFARVGDYVIATRTGEITDTYRPDLYDQQTRRLRNEVTTLLTNQLRSQQDRPRPESEDLLDADAVTIDRIPTKQIRTALRYQGLAHKMMAAYPLDWYERLCNFVEHGCRPCESRYRLKVLQDVLVECVTDGKPFSPIWEIGDSARQSQRLRTYLDGELLQSFRNHGMLAEVVTILLDCAIRGDGQEFSRSVRQIAEDSNGMIEAKHVGRYLERVVDGYGASCELPVFLCQKGKPGGMRATRFRLNPDYAYLLDLI